MDTFLQGLARRIVDEHGCTDLPGFITLGLIRVAIDEGEVTFEALYNELRFRTRGSSIESVVVEMEGRGKLIARTAMRSCRRDDHEYLLAIANAALRHYMILEMGQRQITADAPPPPPPQKHWIARILRWPWW